MAITKATASAVAPAAKGDLVVGSATNDAAVLGVGTDGQILTADSNETTGLKWVTPASGVTIWTQRLATQSTVFRKVEYNGSNLYVAVGNGGLLYSSPDAITWTSRTSGFGANNIQDVFYGNGLWVAVGDNGTLTTSTDGTTWTARTSNMGTNRIKSVIYANSLWVAVGEGGGTTNTGGIIYSTDGTTWTRKSQSLTVGSTYETVIWNGTNWVVGSDNNTNNHLYASTPSGTWTAGQTGSSTDVYKILWDGTRHITYEGATMSARYSTSTTLGTTTAINNAHSPVQGNAGSTYYYNNAVYLTNGYYWATMTTASSANVNQTVPQILPVRMRTATPFLDSSGATAIFASASGLIFAGQIGIYTSF